MKYFRDKRTRDNFLKLKPGNTITVYDTETVGLDSSTDDIIQFAGQKYLITEDGWKLLKEYNQLIKPKNPIPLEITKINHISDEMVADKPMMKEAFAKIKELMEADFWCGHNIIGFDNKFMKTCYDLMKEELPTGYYNNCDTLDAVADLVDHKECKKYNLGSMCDFFGIEEDMDGTEGFHDALYDVRQCAAVARTCQQMYLDEPTPEEKYSNPEIEPIIYGFKPWKAYPKAYMTGNYYVITTNCGTFMYDRYQQVWSGKPYRPVSWQKVLEATYKKLGFHSDSDMLFWESRQKDKK